MNDRITEADQIGAGGAAADVNVQGFETFNRPNGFYDLAISNVPFGDYLRDPRRSRMLAVEALERGGTGFTPFTLTWLDARIEDGPIAMTMGGILDGQTWRPKGLR